MQLGLASQPSANSAAIQVTPLTLGAEVWSGPIRRIGSVLFFASFVLVASRLQGRKFLARESRQ